LRVVTGGAVRPASVHIQGGTIVSVAGYDELPEGCPVVDARGAVVMPGLVDAHVHINEPGRTEWEGFETATRAAAAGGVTSLVDMPLNSIPPTTTVAHLEKKARAAEGRCLVDVGFWGGAVPGNLGELRGLHDAGVFGFKCFLLHSGVDEFPPLHPSDLDGYMETLRGFDGLLIVHAEDSTAIGRAPSCHGRRYLDFLFSRPRAAENLAIAQVIQAARRTGARAHILHLSSSDALPMLAGVRRDGVGVTAETCPHYLVLTAEEVPDGATQFKCCPPVREASNREPLWRGLADGTIDCVVSDHSPCTRELKRLDVGDFGLAWGGISSLELGLSVVWTEARRRGFSLTDVVRWMAEGPARLLGLQSKGRIGLAYDADFCVFAPDEAFVVDPERLHQKNPLTPYDGRPLLGVVRGAWLRGEEVAAERPRGHLLTRGGA
jgi:allantoinase